VWGWFCFGGGGVVCCWGFFGVFLGVCWCFVVGVSCFLGGGWVVFFFFFFWTHLYPEIFLSNGRFNFFSCGLAFSSRRSRRHPKVLHVTAASGTKRSSNDTFLPELMLSLGIWASVGWRSWLALPRVLVALAPFDLVSRGRIDALAWPLFYTALASSTFPQSIGSLWNYQRRLLCPSDSYSTETLIAGVKKIDDILPIFLTILEVFPRSGVSLGPTRFY